MKVSEWFADFFELDGEAEGAAIPDAAQDDVPCTTMRLRGFGVAVAAMVVATSFATIGLGDGAPSRDSADKIVAVPYVVPPSKQAWLEQVLTAPSETVIASLDWLA